MSTAVEPAEPVSSADRHRNGLRATWPLDRRDAGILLAWFVGLTAVGVAIGMLLTGPLDGSAVTRTDEAISRWFADRRTPTLDDLTWVGSMLADTVVKITVTAVVAVAMLWAWRSWREPLMVVLALVLEATTFIVVTTIVGRPRPDVVRLEGSPVDSSFPSGHTAAAAAYGAIVVVIWWRTDRRWVRVASATLVAVIVVAVAFSRTYRGMHHLIDVVAGGLLGIVSVVAVWLVLRDPGPDDLPPAPAAAPLP
ncbi:MAG: phosphatase PAP2 family protein [Ilumatobacteraceae bacterium]